MEKDLPSRPHLDHLRRQAKSLLAALEKGDPEAVATLAEFLPAAKGMKPAQIERAGFRLADAQSAIARQTGFESWPQLARHVEQLRALEGTWTFAQLQIEGTTVPASGLTSSRLLIDGDRFRTESPEGVYEGVFNIDVEAEPHHIDIEFVAGPEAGNWNYGIFRFSGAGRDVLEICLDVNGKPRPGAFKSTPGSGHAYETLVRESADRPASVTGGVAPTPQPPIEASGAEEFAYLASATLARLQGEWSAVAIVRDGAALPAFLLKTGRRIASGNEVKVFAAGQLVIHALVRINEKTTPMQIDYRNLACQAPGSVQLGIMEWRGEEVCFCMAAQGKERPAEFTSETGSGRTLSQWRFAKR